ncbi:MAG: hypothetical protein DSO09_04895 [Candidatus Methanomethylicota archaeon]|jgi:endonuclease III-like uncharacterized protein|uniref:HhH-GPD domain-containing protein n=1 Tax=Thermoproteota archaeon TaxID=2056631 RepID=A0A520KEI0_9CREN|nr:MAG: hypothetical protein EF809_05105 [Candidatus Verstraetearchaeota archaeon]TDA38223.1 MAG: hypothetical protein DSO09_04895 [Candidatus Verstraetearchaeota archaeon]
MKLDLLLYPSFALPLFDIKENFIVKKYGFCSNLIIKRIEDGYIVIHDNLKCLKYAKYILGLWFNPWSYINEISNNFKSIILNLLRMYPNFSLSVSPLDDLAIFTSIVLSRRTNYHINTIKWLKTLMENYQDLSTIAKENFSNLLKITKSYQIKDLPRLLSYYLNIRDIILSKAISARKLLFCKGIGPKVLYSYLLHVQLDTSYAPIDSNLEFFIKNLKIYKKYSKPNKKYCMINECNNCKLTSCIEYKLRRDLGKLTGWFQTLVYLHTKKFCRKKVCSTCYLKSNCNK